MSFRIFSISFSSWVPDGEKEGGRPGCQALWHLTSECAGGEDEPGDWVVCEFCGRPMARACLVPQGGPLWSWLKRFHAVYFKSRTVTC